MINEKTAQYKLLWLWNKKNMDEVGNILAEKWVDTIKYL